MSCELIIFTYNKLKIKTITQNNYDKKREKLFKNFEGTSYKSFLIFNSSSTAKAISQGRKFYNIEENTDGKYARIFIGDEKFSEGVSLSDTLHVHLFEPFYSLQGEKQAIARAVRKCSHKRLPYKDRIVKIHKYYNKNMTDDFISKYALKKQGVLQKIINSTIYGALEN